MYKDGYYVIGGHYSPFCYGHTKTLHAAKLLATKNSEYWDDLQGWNTPSIYAACDCEVGPCGDVFPWIGDDKSTRRIIAAPVSIKINGKWYDRAEQVSFYSCTLDLPASSRV